MRANTIELRIFVSNETIDGIDISVVVITDLVIKILDFVPR